MNTRDSRIRPETGKPVPSLPVANLKAKNMITRPSRNSLMAAAHMGGTSSPTDLALARLRSSRRINAITAAIPRMSVGVFTTFEPLARMRFGPTCGM